MLGTASRPTIVEADSHEAAARMFENHPHFSIFPGDSVEIMECLPMPQAWARSDVLRPETTSGRYNATYNATCSR